MGNRLSRPNLFMLPYYHRVTFILCTRSTSEAKSSQLAGKPNAAAFRTEHDAKRALPAKKNREPAGSRLVKSWSGQRDSNPRPSPWQGDALPAEPCPHIGSRLEATPRFELGVKALQASALPLGHVAIPWRLSLQRPVKQEPDRPSDDNGADNGIRTRDPHLGKVMLYQLSHVRIARRYYKGSGQAMQALISRNSRLVRKRPPGVDSRVDPYTFTFSQNSAGRVRLSSGCFPDSGAEGAPRERKEIPMSQRRQRLYRRLDRAERAAIERGLDKNRPARAMARDLGRSPVERRRRGQAQPHRHARAGQGVEGRVGARGRLRQAPRLAARLQRLQQAPLPLLDAVPLRVLRGPRPAAGRRRAVRRQARGGTARRRSSSPSPPRSGPTWPAACRRRR